MKDNEIIKALEICTSEHLGCEDGCPYRMGDCLDDGYRSVPMKDALDLIKRQKAEIERLEKANESFSCMGKFYREIKSEAIKEHNEKVKNALISKGFHTAMVRKALEEIEQEMTE